MARNSDDDTMVIKHANLLKRTSVVFAANLSLAHCDILATQFPSGRPAIKRTAY
jgi:hypothetical protein